MRTYTVIALYEDNLQPFAESYQANNPDGAVKKAQKSVKGNGQTLIIAAVVEGVPDIVAY